MAANAGKDQSGFLRFFGTAFVVAVILTMLVLFIFRLAWTHCVLISTRDFCTEPKGSVDLGWIYIYTGDPSLYVFVLMMGILLLALLFRRQELMRVAPGIVAVLKVLCLYSLIMIALQPLIEMVGVLYLEKDLERFRTETFLATASPEDGGKKFFRVTDPHMVTLVFSIAGLCLIGDPALFRRVWNYLAAGAKGIWTPPKRGS